MPPTNGELDFEEIASNLSKSLEEPLPPAEQIVGSWAATEALLILSIQSLTGEQKQVLRERAKTLHRTIQAISEGSPRLAGMLRSLDYFIGYLGGAPSARPRI